jgi:hypothetical protein
MRYSLLIALVPCALLAQTSAPPAADGSALRKLPQQLKWFQPAGQASASPLAAPANARAGEPRMAFAMVTKCSIPLLRAPMSRGVVDRMAIPEPPVESIDPKFVLPAPAVCEDWKP